MYQRVGACSLCGGDVIGYRGAWSGITHPPKDECSSCFATRADDIIPMVKSSGVKQTAYKEKEVQDYSSKLLEGLESFNINKYEK